MDTSYIPTVIDVRPVGEDTITEDVQGAEQKSIQPFLLMQLLKQ